MKKVLKNLIVLFFCLFMCTGCDLKDIIKDLDEINPIKAIITFKLLGNIITATGKIQGKIKSVCVRCLK